MLLTRRRFVQWVSSVLAALPFGRMLARGTSTAGAASLAAAAAPVAAAAMEETAPLLRAIAPVVLPSALGSEGINQTVTRFLVWTRDYKAGAQKDSGYGHTRLRTTGPDPAPRYVAQLNELAAEAQRQYSRPLTDLSAAEKTTLLEAELAKPGAPRDLPFQPDGRHILTDFMSFYFRSSEANDLCYQAQIGRDTCRALDDSTERPPPLRPSTSAGRAAGASLHHPGLGVLGS